MFCQLSLILRITLKDLSMTAKKKKKKLSRHKYEQSTFSLSLPMAKNITSGAYET